MSRDGVHFQDMRVFPYCKFTAVPEIVVMPQLRAGRRAVAEDEPKCTPLTQLGKSHFSCTQGCPFVPECFLYMTISHCSVLHFLGFLAVSSAKMSAPQKQLPFKIQLFLLGMQREAALVKNRLSAK